MNATTSLVKQADEPLRLVVESAPYAMLAADAEGKIVLANAYAETLFGYLRADLLGQPVAFLAPGLRTAHALGKDFINDMRARLFEADGDLRGRRKDGSYFPVEIRWNPVHTAEGSWILASILDVSERKRAESQVRESEERFQDFADDSPVEVAFARQKLESLGLLASGLAHDFNNMQSGIIALSEIVLDDPDLDEGVAEELRKIRKIALHGSEIVHELMVYAGEDEVDLGLVDISALIEEMRELLHVSISKRAILKTHLAKGLLPVLANATHIRQVLMNLVVNASEAIGENRGVIEVSTSRWRGGARHLASNGAVNNGASVMESDYVQLVVSDTGLGMAKQVQHKIFDPFFTTKVSGRGLGLAVVQGLVRRYGGALEVKSSPGKGTRFEILFPYAHQHAPQRAASGAGPDAADRR